MPKFYDVPLISEVRRICGILDTVRGETRSAREAGFPHWTFDRNGTAWAAQRRLHSRRRPTLYRHRPGHFSRVWYDQAHCSAPPPPNRFRAVLCRTRLGALVPVQPPAVSVREYVFYVFSDFQKTWLFTFFGNDVSKSRKKSLAKV